MPNETKSAIGWALTQTHDNGDLITKDHPTDLVNKVREYFNTNSVRYPTFSYDDLAAYLN